MSPIPSLSRREQQITELIATAGISNKEIAYRLQLTEGTVKVYLTKLFHKLGVGSRFELLIWAYRNIPELRP